MALLIRRRLHPLAGLAVAARWVLAALLLAATAAYAVEGDARVLERRVKAAFLYKFAGYVEWPAGVFGRPDEPVVVGVVGADELAGELEHVVDGRRVGDRPIVIRRLGAGEPVEGVHVLFLGQAVDRGRTLDLLARMRGKPVLTVTETESGWHGDSVINFVIEQDKVRFRISAGAAEDAGLRLGSQLLAVAREVKRGSP